MHEYGHGLYWHQLPRELERLPDRQRVLARHPRVAEPALGEPRRPQPSVLALFYPRVQETYPEQLAGVELDRSSPAINRVKPSLIRIKADEVTYGMHVILRFELEQDIINGRVALRELPQVWNEKMREYLGVDVPDDANGVLQDTHWASGSIGYFPTYLLGSVMSMQIWQKALGGHSGSRGSGRARRVRRTPRVARRERARAREEVLAPGDARAGDREQRSTRSRTSRTCARSTARASPLSAAGQASTRRRRVSSRCSGSTFTSASTGMKFVSPPQRGTTCMWTWSTTPAPALRPRFQPTL